ncbi:energy-coupling factor transporter transmembrane component T [Wukongibacter baidiensis]|uniref:energy-coupling factor transporter transmembrane component T n=1 Tax=Wukongibacter baidiensis TaxID=1723361 RepID=UPI003D7F938D
MLKLHPFSVIILTGIIFFAVIFYNHPIYIAFMLMFLISSFILLGENKKLKNALKYSLFMILLIIIINPIVSNNGMTVIYKGLRLPIIGRFKITLEAIVFGVFMGLKLMSMTLVFLLYSILIDVDDSFGFFSKYAHKLTLTLSMTTNIIHRLRLEITRVRDVMVLRGANLNEKNILKRIKAYYPILKVVLISSLEGSINRAEALHSRGYGKGKRTLYSKLEFKPVDYILTGLSFIFLGLLIYGWATNKGSYSYYPRLEGYEYKDIIFLVIMSIPMLINLVLIWGCKRWKFLKYKI